MSIIKKHYVTLNIPNLHKNVCDSAQCPNDNTKCGFVAFISYTKCIIPNSRTMVVTIININATISTSPFIKPLCTSTIRCTLVVSIDAYSFYGGYNKKCSNVTC